MENIPVFMIISNDIISKGAVALTSIVANTSHFVNFYIIQDREKAISPENLEKLDKINKRYKNFSYEIITLGKENVEGLKLSSADYVKADVYFKYFMPDLKPEIEKAVYIDYDVVCQLDIVELYNTDLEDNIIGAIQNEPLESLSPYAIKVMQKINFKNPEKYFNAGVFVIDCVAWRKNNITEKLIETTRLRAKEIEWADQDVLNIIFENSHKNLPRKFNMYPRFIPDFKDESCIIHYVGPDKPWKNKKGCNKFFWDYAKKTPFYNQLLKSYNNGKRKMSRRIKDKLKTHLRPLAHILRKFSKLLNKDCLKDIDRSAERWTWDRFKRIEKTIQDSVLMCSSDFIPYKENEKIRILFLFQVASFWPNWESFYNSCVSDNRIEVTFAFLPMEGKFGDVAQMHTAMNFLQDRGIPFSLYDDSLLINVKPHVAVFQTPYDPHRAPHCRSNVFKRFGTRIVYIPYGIEIADTEIANKDHFFAEVVLSAWRIFTFSDTMRFDYLSYSPNGKVVRCFGHPKFDGLYNAKRLPLSPEVVLKAAGRKIVLWHTHFPKYTKLNDGQWKMVTPYLGEYIKIAEKIKDFSEFFFIFLPHPKFLCDNPSLQPKINKIMELLRNAENVYIDTSDDYRSSLVNADFIISDRSALMVEAAAVGVPVLYMYNSDYQEPVTRAIEPLMESYYSGTGYKNVEHFLSMCRNGEDPKKEQREAAFRQCIPYFDGKCGERIKEDIVASLQKEQNQSFEAQFEALVKYLHEQNTIIEERLSNLEQKLLQKENVVDSIDSNILPAIDKSIERWTWERYQRTQKGIDNNLNKLYKLNEIGVNIFQYMTGIELNNNFIKEREIVFNPKNVPADHYKRYEFAVNHICEDDLVADIACACGYGSSMLSKKAKKVVGVDINPDVINFAKKIYGNEKIDFYCQDAQKLTLDYNFTKAVSFETLEHILYPELFLKTLYNLLSDDGQIICSVPNESVNPYVRGNNKFHYRHYTKDEFIDLVQSSGFHVKELYYQYWDDDCNISKEMPDKTDAKVLVIVASKIK